MISLLTQLLAKATGNDEVRQPAHNNTNAFRSKMPAPPKFDGSTNKEITNIKIWMHDMNRYAQRNGVIPPLGIAWRC
jgi:hypothetical protein